MKYLLTLWFRRLFTTGSCRRLLTNWTVKAFVHLSDIGLYGITQFCTDIIDIIEESTRSLQSRRCKPSRQREHGLSSHPTHIWENFPKFTERCSPFQCLLKVAPINLSSEHPCTLLFRFKSTALRS